MQDIPRWIKDYLVKKSCCCGKCQHLLTEKHISAIGIRLSCRNPTKEALYVELTCLQCGFITKYELRYMMLVELSLDTIQDLQLQQIEDEEKEKNKKNKQEENQENIENIREEDETLEDEEDYEDEDMYIKSKKRKSKITLKDIKDSSKFLKKIKNHSDLLEAMGMNPEEIAKYDDLTEKD